MQLPVWKSLYRLLKILGCPVEWEVSVGAVVFQEATQREYLLLHYPSGHFDFPKGHIEAGETEEQTLRRETEEETGIRELSVLPLRLSIKYFYRAKGEERERRLRSGKGIWIFKMVHFYPARTNERTVSISHEHIGYVWLPYGEALKRVTFENARRILSLTEAHLASSV